MPSNTSKTKLKPRKLRKSSRKWWKRTPKTSRTIFQPMPSGWNILKQALRIIRSNKKLFVIMLAIYAVVSIVIIQGIGSIDVTSIKNEVADTLGNGTSQVAVSVSILGYILSNNTSLSLYQSALLIVVSLAIIWSLRQLAAGHKIKARDAYYNGMTPLAPFILAILNIILRLIPFALGAAAYNVIVTYGIASGLLEVVMWALVAVVLMCWSVYLLVPAIIGLYVVTLPGMTPIKAIKAAHKLVHFRRWNVIRKLLLIVVAILLILSLVMVPVIIFAASVASWVFFATGLLLVVLFHAYMYTLYRELLDHA